MYLLREHTLRRSATLSQPPEYAERECHNRPYQGHRATDRNPYEPEWQQEQPHEWVEHKREKRKRPAQDK
jgi:hypothetical protein